MINKKDNQRETKKNFFKLWGHNNLCKFSQWNGCPHARPPSCSRKILTAKKEKGEATCHVWGVDYNTQNTTMQQTYLYSLRKENGPFTPTKISNQDQPNNLCKNISSLLPNPSGPASQLWIRTCNSAESSIPTKDGKNHLPNLLPPEKGFNDECVSSYFPTP